MNDENRLKRLAASIDRLAVKDEEVLRRRRAIASQRREAAAELHRICAVFVEELNAQVASTVIALDPPRFEESSFSEDDANLVQINARGRIIQVEFKATERDVSTEEFRVPYILQGEVRAFNQELLERHVIRDHMLFYCLERHGPMWRFFEPRTYRSGPFDRQYLIEVMEHLV